MTGSESVLLKKQIEIQLAEYEQAVRDAIEWYAGWKRRQSEQGFRCVVQRELTEN